MLRIALTVAALAVAASTVAINRASKSFNRPDGRPGTPVVLELYQSQGCSSCPPALEVLRQEADLPNVIALSFAVTYWDQLGWKDSFAQPAFTQRQWDYARANGRDIVATPQMIINGRTFVNGGNRAEVDAAVAHLRKVDGPSLAIRGGRLIVGMGTTKMPARILLVSYDPRTIAVPIRAGENGGRTLPHRNVVRHLEVLGQWNGASRSYPLPAPAPGLVRAILLQAGTGGPILAARLLA